jgi:alpha-glucosidase (family GH31 glycosyl hydrolase)
LKVTPILNSLKSNETTMTAYFPNGTWVNIYDPTEIITGGKNVTLKTTNEHTNVHLMPGKMFAFQDNDDM